MLILTRKADQALVIDGNTTVRVLSIDGDRVKLGIDAPPEITVVRDELLQQVAGENVEAARRSPGGIADSLKSIGQATSHTMKRSA